MSASLFGAFAASMTTGAWIPQILRTWRSRSASDLSWGYLATTGTGITAWLIYGISEGDAPLYSANSITLAFVLTLSGLKASSDARTRRTALGRTLSQTHEL